MYEAIILEKLDLLKISLNNKTEYIRILSNIGKNLWNNHSKESFEIICNKIDLEIEKIKL